MQKQWQLRPPVSQEFINQFPEINEVILQLLYNRGFNSQKDIDDFLSASYDDGLFDPYLFKEMTKAVERLWRAFQQKEKVMIYGDYDADGVCSTVILYQTLKSLGLEVDTYIPFREGEGYGLNTKIVQQFIAQKYQLLITVDCGIANQSEIKLLKENNIDVIVLDHHEEPLELPPALAIINPALKNSGYPAVKLCGAGVVFKFVQALMIYLEKNNSPLKLPVGFDKWLLDLVAIATVGDIVPLVSENRLLVKYGLLVLGKTKNLGLKKMLEKINNRSSRLDSEYLAWRLAPRLNAAGRINHASVAFNLLISVSEEEASKWAEILENNNRQRQEITEKILNRAFEQVGEVGGETKFLIVCGEGWPAGILGLVAGRLCDKFQRPTLVFTEETAGGEKKYVASGRSIDEFDITAALKECHDLLLRYGGHPQACGLTILSEKNYSAFCQKIKIIVEEKLTGVKLLPTLEIEAKIKAAQINWELLVELEKFEPFGEGNAKPLLLLENLKIEQVQTVGADGKHLKILASQDNDLANLHKLIGFSFGEWCAIIKPGDKIDIVFELDVNEWNGNRELQLKIIDLRLSKY